VFTKTFHQTVKYGLQRYHILQDLIGLESEISMMASKNQKPVFSNRKLVHQKTAINIPTCKYPHSA